MPVDDLVSIVTPTFNRRQYLRDAVHSVLDQTYPHFELHVVDDGSYDGTREMIESEFGSEPRIRYQFQENQGQSVARNRGVEASSGRYLGFLDSDNLWVRDKLEVQVRYLGSNPDVDIVYGDGITIDENGDEITRANMRRYSGHIAPLLIRDNFVSFNTTLVRRECFDEMGGFDESIRFGDDYELWLRFSARYRFQYLPQFFSYYRVMPEQISSDKIKRFQSNERILRDFMTAFPETLTEQQRNEGWAYFFTRRGRYHASRGERIEALKWYAKALGKQPASRVPWRALAKLVLKGTG